MDHDKDGQYSTAIFRDEAIRTIRNHNQDDPLFMYLSFQTPHAPLQYEQSWYDHFSGIANDNRRKIAAMMASLDEAVGKVMLIGLTG